ncbi:prepilin-type N-terminal cleavage/methylation domain-containing protein [Aquimarina mytili]|uniref:Prepilin-type N-terminal cleavage/methylation domain-containing protein n=1 Tax=Aquimarina mytili TaxID=874423 RepID=A0A937A4I4_9FLAO|nr:prepilin-type N-terminal cleavage/methylation domain-containing protein [Aquimarina mytili]MBL0684199.1 prepilin-type N-terminal cleavage/methylation domain-containing protein [Aquimarina mytili]
MSKITSKIKAFTLTEIMVVIVISTIVAGLAFTVLGVVQNNMRTIGDNYEKKSKIKSLETALTIDFNSFSDATWDSKENKLKVFSPIGERVYQFYTDSIVTNIETYPVRVEEKIFYFEGKPVTSGVIDAIKLNFDKKQVSQHLFVFKYNDPTLHF